jgi:putative membrane protein
VYTASQILIALVALAHIGFLVLEMFFWDHPTGRKIFHMTPEQSAATRVLAANQGLYNGFLAAGLIWALWSDRFDLKVFFLGCVIVAGLYGAATAKRTILYTQALPAALALAAVILAQ